MSIISRIVSKSLYSIANFDEELKRQTVKELADKAEIRAEHLSKYLTGKSAITFEKGLEIATKWERRRPFVVTFRSKMMFGLNEEYLDGCGC